MNSQLPPSNVKEKVQGRLKWFNKTKGFGFVETDDENKDAFLHATLVGHDQLDLLLPGTSLLVDLAKGERGLVCSAVYEIDPSTATPEAAAEANPVLQESGEPKSGIVKFYNNAKGYGFLTPDDGGPDVFLPGRVMQACGFYKIEPNTRLDIEVQNNDRGPQAVKAKIAADGGE